MAVNQIPIIVPPEEDEYIYSYICRLAKINGFSNVNSFIYNYVAVDMYSQEHDVSYIVRRYCRTMYIPKFAEAVGQADKIVAFYRSLSLYPCTSITMLPEQQVMHLNYIFRSKKNFADFLGRTRGSNQPIKYCPECEKEQIAEKGYFWIKRAHQLPGVNVCHKHSCLLNEYTGSPFNCLYADTLEGKPVDGDCTDDNIGYARFVNDLNNNDYKINRNNLKIMFYHRFSDVEADEVRYKSVLKNLLPNKRDRKAILKDLLSGRLYRITDVQILAALYLIFETSDVFKQYIKDIDIPEFAQSDYTVIGEYNPNISLIRHKCGHAFVGTEYGIDVGWGCPECLSKYSQKEFAMHLFNKSYPEGYSLVEPYVEGDTFLRIRHDVCGEIKQVSFRELLKRTDCQCLTTKNTHLVKDGSVSLTNTYRTPEIKKKEQNINLEKDGSEFTIKEYIDSMGPAKIYHEVCGKTFDVPRYSRFALKKKCPYCKNKAMGIMLPSEDLLYKAGKGKEMMAGSVIHGPITEKGDFITTMKQLVGDDYELVSEYKNSYMPIKLKHNTCGHTFMTTGSRFCNGQRCKCETFYTNDEQFMDAFVQCTDNFYDIVKAPNQPVNYYKITEKTTGKEAIMSKAQLTQELNRATPSKIINNSHRHKFTGAQNSVKRVYMKMLYRIILEHIDKHGIFNLDEIRKHCDYSMEQLYKTMTRLRAKNAVEYTGITKCYRLINTHLYDE